jgi:hypothetical protein
VLFVVHQFLSDRRQSVVVDSSSSHMFDVVSGVPQCSVMGPLLFSFHC